MAEEILTITSSDVSTHEDPLTLHFKEIGAPFWQKLVNIGGHELSLVNYNPDFEFTDGHEQDLLEYISRVREISPQILERFRRIVFDKSQPGSRYSSDEHPFNGTLLPDGVLLYKNGQRRDVIHRTGKATNFQGTVAHEGFHMRNEEYKNAWREAFGWHQCYEYPGLWEMIEERKFKNRETGEIVHNGQFTDYPELCVTDYARQAWDDDYADSGVVALFEPERLEGLSSKKLSAIQDISTISSSS
jgi:hypothetical protein